MLIYPLATKSRTDQVGYGSIVAFPVVGAQFYFWFVFAGHAAVRGKGYRV